MDKQRQEESGATFDAFGFYDAALAPNDTQLTYAISHATDRYVNFQAYAEGGLKRIQLCDDLRTGRQVAMASLLNAEGPGHTETFLREARIGAALQHPNIVPVYDVGMTDGKPWFTMKFLDGKTLWDCVNDVASGNGDRYGELSARLGVFTKVCDAIAYAHSMGVHHLDLKPANVRVSDFGEVAVCDWGLSNITAIDCDEHLLNLCDLTSVDIEHKTVNGILKGTPGYMAPEQVPFRTSQKDHRTDVFSLGAILYTIVTLRCPFTGTIQEIIKNTAEGKFLVPSKATTPSAVPESLEAVCLKAMALDPKDRYQTVEDLQGDLNKFLDGHPTLAENASISREIKLLILRHKALSLLISISMSLAVAFTAVFIQSKISQNQKLIAERESLFYKKQKAETEAKADRDLQKYHARLNTASAPRFVELARSSYENYNLEDALKFCKTAIELDSSMVDAWIIKGSILLGREEIKVARECLMKGNASPRLIQICDAQILRGNVGSPMSNDDFIQLLRQVDSNYTNLFSSMVHQKCRSENFSIDDRIIFCRSAILIANKRLSSSVAGWNFRYNQETKHLDISGNRWIMNALAIQHFPAISVDASDTQISHFGCFNGMPIDSLNVSGTMIQELDSLHEGHLSRLADLNISRTWIRHLRQLQHSVIINIDISNTPIDRIYRLRQMKCLRKLTIHEGQFSDSDFKRIPSVVEVKIVPRKVGPKRDF